MKKLLALIIDYAYLIVIMFLIYLLVTILSALIGSPGWVEEGLISNDKVAFIERKFMVLITVIFTFFYYGQPFKKYVQTIGDKVMKIRILPKGREKIGIWYGLLRTFCLAPILAIVGLIPLKGDPYNTVLDKVCKTRTEYLT